MTKKKKPKIEFRYYSLPSGSPILALLGEKWIQEYGEHADWMHFHNYMEIGYCYYGEGDLVLGEKKMRFKGRQFTVIPRNVPHTTESDYGVVSRWEFLFIDLEKFLYSMPQTGPGRTEKMIRRITGEGGVLRNEEDYPKLAEKLLKILDVMRGAEEFYIEEATGLLYSMLSELARVSRDEILEPAEEENVHMVNVVSRALDYISEHYMEEIKVGDLARLCHISESHFRRVFSSYMKMSPLEYLNTVRIREACEYLSKTDESVANIAYKCGFMTSSTFNRKFRQIMGTTPVEWRKKTEDYERKLLNYDIHPEEGW